MDELKAAQRRLVITGFLQAHGRNAHAFQHQRVPGRQDLVVAAGPHPLFPFREQFFPGALQVPGYLFRFPAGTARDLLRALRHVEMPAPFEVVGPVQAGPDRKVIEFGLGQQPVRLARFPGVEFPFLPLRIRVQ